MKKALSLFIAVCMVIVSVMAMTSCGEKKLETVNGKTVLEAVKESGETLSDTEALSVSGSIGIKIASGEEDEGDIIDFTFTKKGGDSYTKITLNSDKPGDVPIGIEAWYTGKAVYFICNDSKGESFTGKILIDVEDISEKLDVSSLLQSTGISFMGLESLLSSDQNKDRLKEEGDKIVEKIFEKTYFTATDKGYAAEIDIDKETIVSSLSDAFINILGKPFVQIIKLLGASSSIDTDKMLEDWTKATEKLLSDALIVNEISNSVTFDKELRITGFDNKVDLRVSLTKESFEAFVEKIGLPVLGGDDDEWDDDWDDDDDDWDDDDWDDDDDDWDDWDDDDDDWDDWDDDDDDWDDDDDEWDDDDDDWDDDDDDWDDWDDDDDDWEDDWDDEFKGIEFSVTESASITVDYSCDGIPALPESAEEFPAVPLSRIFDNIDMLIGLIRSYNAR